MNEQNIRRAARGRLAINRLARSTSQEERLIDLLADLRHAAEAEGLDFENAARIAEAHYNAERGSE